MDDKMFDTWMRRAVRATDRRAVLGLLSSVILATIPSLTLASDDHGHGSGGDGKHGGGGKHDGGKGKGGKGKGGKKNHEKKGVQSACNADSQECLTHAGNYCYYNYYFSGQTYIDLCQDAYIACCVKYTDCTQKAYNSADACVAATRQIW